MHGIGAQIHHAASLDAGRDQAHRSTVACRNRLRDLDILLVDLGPAVLRRRLVAPLLEREMLRVGEPRSVDLAGERDVEPVGGGGHMVVLERILASRAQTLQTEAGIAPIPVAA